MGGGVSTFALLAVAAVRGVICWLLPLASSLLPLAFCPLLFSFATVVVILIVVATVAAVYDAPAVYAAHSAPLRPLGLWSIIAPTNTALSCGAAAVSSPVPTIVPIPLLALHAVDTVVRAAVATATGTATAAATTTTSTSDPAANRGCGVADAGGGENVASARKERLAKQKELHEYELHVMEWDRAALPNEITTDASMTGSAPAPASSRSSPPGSGPTSVLQVPIPKLSHPTQVR